MPGAEQVFLRACELCEELGDAGRLPHALRGLFGVYYVAGRWADAARVAERFGRLAEGLDDRAAHCLRWYVDGATHVLRGAPAEACRRLREGMRHYDEADRAAQLRRSGIDTGTAILAHLSLAEWLAGCPEAGARASAEALATARRVAHPFSLAQCLSITTAFHMLSRDWDAAGALAAELREIADRYGLADYIACGKTMVGVTLAAGAEAGRGLALAREGLAGLRRGGWACIVPLHLARLALTLAASGDAEEAVETAAEALLMTRTNGEAAWEAEALRALAEARLASGEARAPAAEADLREALDVARRQGTKGFELRAAASLARLLAKQGERQRAVDLLAPVHAWFTEGFDTPDLRDARALLDDLQ